MEKRLLIIIFVLIANAGLAQSAKDTLAGKDSLVYAMPIVNGHLVYSDSIKAPGKSKAKLDTIVSKWFIGYFKYHRPDTLAKHKDPKAQYYTRQY